MTASDIKTIKAMLTLIKKHAKEKNEDSTVEEIEEVISVLDEKMKEAN